MEIRKGEKRIVDANITAPATPEAKRWDGWGTALKPAWEPIVVARKPVIGIELDADSVEIARRRIEHARKQPRLV